MNVRDIPDRGVALVVDDEPLIAMLTADLLEEFGFTTISASSGDEAARILDDRDDVALVITDIDMRGTLHGLDLARHIKTRRPQVRVVVVSGRYQPRDEQLPPDVVFLSKPYREGQLEQAALGETTARKRKL